MNFEELKDSIPDYAKDLRLNLSSLRTPIPGMTETQVLGCMLACAINAKVPALVQAVFNEAQGLLRPEDIAGAQTAAAIMAMNNVYYRFLDQSGREDYAQARANLRMNGMVSQPAHKADFELWSLAVSAMNGCSTCIKSHRAKLEEEGIEAEVIRQGARIAAVIQAVAVVLTSQDVMAAAVVAEAA